MQHAQSNVHPAYEFMQEIASKAISTEQVINGFPALWAHLQECEECLAAFTELMRLAHQEGHSEESETRRAVVMTALASILAIFILVGGFLLWQNQTEETIVNRVYSATSPAVANIQVTSAGVTGSGVVLDTNGHLLTNYHVINQAQNNADIAVQLPGLDPVSAELVGYDIATDLAVLELNAPPERLTAAQFGDSDDVRVGDLAIAIGNPFGLSQSVTVGHISALQRRLMSNDMYAPDVDGVLQTDAAINPGNSGGPLFNARGQVIGINTRIESPSGGSVGLGFAVPSDTALAVAREIIAQGYVRRPFLGAGGRPIDATLARDLSLSVDHGLLVQEVHPDSPAEKAGLLAGAGAIRTTRGEVKTGADVILSIDGQPVRNQSDLNQLVAQHELGDTIKVDILRNGERLTLAATLTERPPELAWGQKPTSDEDEVAGPRNE